MNKNLVETVLGAVVLLGAIAFLSFGMKSTDRAPSQGYTVTASFADIGALRVGDDVRIGGVAIGAVTKVSLNADSYMANLVMGINSDIRLPDDTAALISSEGLMGGAYVALEPGGSEDYLSDGGRIAYTQAATNLEQLLGKFIFTMNDNKDKADADPAPASTPSAAPAAPSQNGINLQVPATDSMF